MGRPEKLALLNEDQAIFLLNLSRNTKKVVALKKGLTITFGRYRRQAERRATVEWQEARAKGKIARRLETDTIKVFVEYATRQGSKNAKRYYENITRMEYRALFFLDAVLMKEGNLRDRLDLGQLSSLDVADRVVSRTLQECMEVGMHYKNIYQAAKDKVNLLAAVVGKCNVPALDGPANAQAILAESA